MQSDSKSEHIKRDAHGTTRLLVRLPISIREQMGEASARLEMSQQAIVRSALAAFMLANGPKEEAPKPRKRGRTPKGGAE